MGTKIIEAATFEIVAARDASRRVFGSVDLAEAAGFDPDSGTVRPDGSVVFEIPAIPRGLAAHGRINGREGASTFLPREVVRTLAAIYATPTGEDGKPTGKPDASKVAAIMERFPASGEPDAPKREDRATVAATRDAFLAFLAGRSWNLSTKSARKSSLL